jgi:hypothetical protein
MTSALNRLREALCSPVFVSLDNLCEVKLHFLVPDGCPFASITIPLDANEDLVLLRPRIIACIFHNFYKGDKALPIITWWRIVTDIDSVLAVDEEQTLNARASLLLTMSHSSVETVLRLAGLVGTVVAELRALPEQVVAMLNSPASLAAFSASVLTRQVHHCPVPQAVLSVTIMDSSVLGWVCMWGSIALHRQLFEAGEPAEQDRLTLSLFSIAGHEVCHGRLRQAAGNFNAQTLVAARYDDDASRQQVALRLFSCFGNSFRVGSAAIGPDIHAESGCGRAWERHLWKGHCPQWHQPSAQAAANKLAGQLVARFNESQDFVVTEEDARRIVRFVGTRMASADEGGLVMSIFRQRTCLHG